MLHVQAKAKGERSFQTILDNTTVIDRIEAYTPFYETIEVRSMLSRTHKESQHFIVTLSSDVKRAQDTSVVKPLAEVAIRGDKMRFTVNPKKQYPDMPVSEELLHQIERSVASFMKNNFATNIDLSDLKIA